MNFKYLKCEAEKGNPENQANRIFAGENNRKAMDYRAVWRMPENTLVSWKITSRALHEESKEGQRQAKREKAACYQRKMRAIRWELR